MDSVVEKSGVAEQEKQIPVIPGEKAEKASAPLNEEVEATSESVEDTTMWKGQESKQQIKIVQTEAEKPDPLGRKIGSLPMNEMKAGYDYAFGKGKNKQRRA